MSSFLLLAQDGNDLAMTIFWVVYLGFLILMLASVWTVFTKAGQPGWASIVPIYNLYVMTQIAMKPWYWMLLMIIPFIGIIFAILMTVDIAKAFGKGIGFAVGLIFLPFIFWPILAFGNARYLQPVGI